jgi:acyl-CoA hydrolase
VHRWRPGDGRLVRAHLRPRVLSPTEILDELRPGETVYIPGASGELRFLQECFASAPDRLAGVTLLSCLVPGINTFDYAALDPTCRLDTFLLPPPLRPSFEERRVAVFPLAYSAIATHLAGRPIDVGFFNVTPARDGLCSFGIAADFGPIVARTARRRIGILNRAMPRPLHSPSISLEAFDAIVEIDEPPRSPLVSSTDSCLQVIAHHVAALIPDGATLQTGIGQAPTAIWRALSSHRELRLWSGIVDDGFFSALDAGAMAVSRHVAGIAYGSAQMYERLNESETVSFADVQTTHAAAELSKIDRFMAINSAIEIDLFGQANLEWQEGRLISGVGGAPDFNSAARSSLGGRSILAMPATARSGSISRITARLTSPTTSLGRMDLDAVVTEHGSVSLRGLSMDERATALIALAGPAYRSALEQAWSDQRQNL